MFRVVSHVQNFAGPRRPWRRPPPRRIFRCAFVVRPCQERRWLGEISTDLRLRTLEPEHHLTQPHSVRFERVRIDAKRAEAEAAHLLAAIGDHPATTRLRMRGSRVRDSARQRPAARRASCRVVPSRGRPAASERRRSAALAIAAAEARRPPGNPLPDSLSARSVKTSSLPGSTSAVSARPSKKRRSMPTSGSISPPRCSATTISGLHSSIL